MPSLVGSEMCIRDRGCVIAGKVNASGIRKTILLAPPREFGTSKMMDRYNQNPLTKIGDDGTYYLPRSDGSTTIVSKDFQEEVLSIIDLPKLYNSISSEEVFLIAAAEDNVLAEFNWNEENIPNIQVTEISGDHSFSGENRDALLNTLQSLIV